MNPERVRPGPGPCAADGVIVDSETPVRAALVGAGLVGQVAHLVTLTRPGSAIRLAAVVDASATRAAAIASAWGVPSATDLAALEPDTLDAVVIAAPDPAHRPLIEAALARGWHVFCEKPLALTAADCDALAAAADAAGRLCQVGYMKRFDPAVDAFKADLARLGGRIAGLAVEVRDPDAAPFIRDVPMVPAGADIDPALLAAGSAAFGAAVASVLDRAVTDVERVAWGSFTGALIHDLNLARDLVQGDLALEDAFVAMDGLEVGLRLRSPEAGVLRLVHTQVPTIADYEERFTIYTSVGVYEIVFPAPYLLHRPTTLRHIGLKDADQVSIVEDLNGSTEEAFDLELQAFARAIVTGARSPERNTFRDAADDIRLLEAGLRRAAGESA
jgi:predicted dehydrogenase